VCCEGGLGLYPYEVLIGCHGGLEETGGRRSAQSLWIRGTSSRQKGKGPGPGFGERREEVGKREDQEIYAVKRVVGEQKTVASPLSVLCGYKHEVLGTRLSQGWQLAVGSWLSVQSSSTFFYNGACLVHWFIGSGHWFIASMLWL
jgi:hypothetical protein